MSSMKKNGTGRFLEEMSPGVSATGIWRNNLIKVRTCLIQFLN